MVLLFVRQSYRCGDCLLCTFFLLTMTVIVFYFYVFLTPGTVRHGQTGLGYSWYLSWLRQNISIPLQRVIMMPRPRKSLINPEETPYYHCISRCVRRAFLCGKDELTGRSYEHRRQWVEDRILYLAKFFCVDVCAYAVMSNHTHTVLRINQSKADDLSIRQILCRWHKLSNGKLMEHRYLSPTERADMSAAQIASVEHSAEEYRQRLCSISWFMRLLNEYIARRANKEDDCTGHFWEGRFKSQALMDEAALVACMAYVDLNPVRAQMADSPETSAHTSILKRLNAAKSGRQPRALLDFSGTVNTNRSQCLPFRLKDYFSLVRSSSHHFRTPTVAPAKTKHNRILRHTGLSPAEWSRILLGIEKLFGITVSVEKLFRQQSHPRLCGFG